MRPMTLLRNLLGPFGQELPRPRWVRRLQLTVLLPLVAAPILLVIVPLVVLAIFLWGVLCETCGLLAQVPSFVRGRFYPYWHEFTSCYQGIGAAWVRAWKGV